MEKENVSISKRKKKRRPRPIQKRVINICEKGAIPARCKEGVEELIYEEEKKKVDHAG